jgi:hypothetical protein
MSRSLSPLSAIVLAMIAPAALVSPVAADDAALREEALCSFLLIPMNPPELQGNITTG